MIDEKLTLATRRDSKLASRSALQCGSSQGTNHVDEVTAKVLAERLVADLEASVFVIMR
jgi:hypothetical protein